MPFITNRNQHIHYIVEGEGSLLIFLHGIFLNAVSWKEAGYIDVLSKTHTVVCIDSLGHGKSDKPIDVECYHQMQTVTEPSPGRTT